MSRPFSTGLVALSLLALPASSLAAQSEPSATEVALSRKNNSTPGWQPGVDGIILANHERQAAPLFSEIDAARRSGWLTRYVP